MRLTNALIQVSAALVERPNDRRWGYELSKLAGVRSGVLYPMLSRMLEVGWLTDGWEDPAEVRGKRPPRRYYELTESGLRELGAIARRAETARRIDPALGAA